jgi:hypothetical protein
MLNKNEPEQPAPQNTDGHSDEGDILQASTTVAGLAVALVAFLPSGSITKIIIFKIGSLGLSLSTALLLCGTLAIAASVWTLDKIRREAGLSVDALLVPKTHLSLLFFSLVIFALIYIGVITLL